MLKNKSISDQTKQAFADALKRALQTKSLSKISITELCKECQVNRKTFYYHFHDINDLVLWIFQKEIKETTHLKFTFPDKMEKSLYYLINYIDENRSMCKAVYDSCYRTQLRESWLSELKELMEKTVMCFEKQSGGKKKDRELIVDFFAGAACELIISYAVQDQSGRTHNAAQRISYMTHLFETAMKEESCLYNYSAHAGTENRNSVYLRTEKC